MKVENKENNRKIQQVAATMAIEDMYMSKDCLQGLIDVANGTKQRLRFHRHKYQYAMWQ